MKLKNFSSISETKISETDITEKGFIFGASEDGTIYFRPKKNQYNIEIEQKILDWLEVVKKAVQDVYSLHVNIRQTSRGPYRLTVLSKQLYNEILGFRKDYGKILSMQKEFQIGFLQGIFDAEGTVHFNRYQIRIASKKLHLIEIIEYLLNKFQIKTGKIHKDKTVYVLPLYGKENLKKFSEIINFRHTEKKNRLSDLISD